MFWRKWRHKYIGICLAVLVLGVCLPGDHSDSADAFYTFIQSTWSNGQSSDSAVHPTNQSSWNSYYSKDDYATTTEINGYLTLAPSVTTLTDTSDVDFNKGSMDKVVVSGSGSDAVIQVTPSVADPFASTLGEWLTLPAQPRPDRFTVFCRADTIIYCLFATGDGRQFGKFTPATGKWVMLAPLPAPAAAGAAIAWDGEAVFALRGEGSKQVFKYTPSTDTWVSFVSLSKGAENGSAMCATGIISTKAGKLFVLLGGNSSDFVIFDPTIGTLGVWKGGSSAPATVEEGGRLLYPGSGNYLYACRGLSTSTIWKYSISADAWDTTTANLPIPDESTAGYDARMYSASNMFWPGSGNYIYAAMPNSCYNRADIRNYQTFWRLGPLSGTPVWSRLADCPRYTDNKGFILYDPTGAGTEIQLLSGNNYTNPWHYNIAQNRWKEITQPLLRSSSDGISIHWIKNGVHSDVVLDSDGFDYICILDHISSDETKPVTGASWQTYWRRLNPYETSVWVTGNVYAEGDIITGTDNLDYRCIRRHLASDTNKPITGADYATYWQTPAVTTRGTAWISAKSYVAGPYDNYLYWFNYASNNFWRYKISTNSWERLANLPWSSSYRGDRFADIGDGYLYYARGSGSYDFARYNLVTDTWEELADMPNNVPVGYGALSGVISKADRVLGTDNLGYICKKKHTAAALNKPVSGADWSKYWELNGSTTDCVVWVESASYSPGAENVRPSIIVGSDNNDYRCIKNHTSAVSSKPITGTTSTWQTYWMANGTTGQGDTWVAGTLYNSRTGTVGHYKFIYVVPNDTWSASYFYRYDPIDNTWITCTNLPAAACGPGVVWPGTSASDKGGYIYVLRGAAATTLYAYDIVLDGWITKTSSAVRQYYTNTGNFFNDGRSQYLYHLSGDESELYGYIFERYDITTDSWSTLAPTPFYNMYGASCQTIDAIWSTPYYGGDQLIMYDLHKPTHNQPGVWKANVYDTCYSSYADGNIAVDKNGYNYMIFGNLRYDTLNSNIWVFDTNAKRSKIVGSDGKDYDCILSHTSTAADFPTTGANWNKYWQTSRSTGKGVIWLDGSNYYCSKHANRWSGLIRAPFDLGMGVKGQYMENENSIYVLEGKNSKYVWQYDIINDRWLRAKDILTNVTVGSELTGGCGITISGHESPRDVLFCLGGGGSTQFNLYFVEPGYDYWTAYLPALDGHAYRGTNSMTYSSYNNKVYKLRTEITSTAYVYDPANDTWGTIDPVGTGGASGLTYTCDESSVLYYPNDGQKYVYCMTGDGNYRLLRYDIDNAKWDELESPPATIATYASAMSSVGNDYIYMFNTTQLDYLFRYHKTENDYDIPAYLPIALDKGGVICGYKGNIYYLCGSSGAFYRFNIGQKKWGVLTTCPSTMPNADPCMKAVEYEGNVSIYVTGGQGLQTFYRYSVANDAWETLTPPPYAWGWGNAVEHVGGNRYIYAMRGGAVSFWKYDILNNEWEDLADLPTTAGRGGALTYPDKGNFIYALSGNRSANFYRYNYTTDTWTTLNPCMVKILDSHSELIYPGFGNYLYVLHGSSWGETYESYTYMRYDILGGSWSELAPASFGVDHPGSMIWPGGEYYYATKGNGRLELAMYYAFCYGSYVSDIKPVGTHSGWGNVSWAFNNMQAAEVSFRSGNKSDLSDALSWDLCADMVNGADLSTASSVKPQDVYIQYKIGFSTDNLLELPKISDVSINYKFYPLKQEIISSPYDTSFPTNRLVKLEWTDQQQVGTDVRFKIRTGKDLASLLTGNWYGPNGSTIEQFTFNNKDEYVANSEILFTGSSAKLYKKLADFAYSESLHVDNTAQTAKTDLTVSVLVTSTNNHFWNHVKSDGADIRFHDGTQELSYYLVSFDSAHKKAEINVNFPNIAANSVKFFYMVYGSEDALSASNSDYVSKPLDGLVGYWKFDENAGLMASDSSGYGNTGALYPTTKNMPTWKSDGKYGSCIYFDGIDDYVRVTAPDLGANYTMAFWGTVDEAPTSNNSWQTAMSAQTSYPTARLNPNNYMYNYWYDPKGVEHGDNFSYLTKRDSIWRHYVMIHDALGYRAYTDSVLNRDYRGFTNTSTSIGTMQWDFGRYFNSNSYNWKGKLDEIVLYNRALTGIEVSYLYQGISRDYTYGVTFGIDETAATCASLVSAGWQKKISVQVTNAGGLKSNAVIRIDLGKWYEFWAHVKSDASDIRVVDSDDTTVLSYHIPEWDYANKKGFILAKTASLASSAAKTVYLYYGNSSAVSAAVPASFMGLEEGFTSNNQVAGDSVALSGWSYKMPAMLKNDSGAPQGQALVIGSDSKDYKCIKSHTSSTYDNKPTGGTNWATYWQDNSTTGKGVAWVVGTVYSSSPAVVRVDMENSWASFWANVKSDGSDVRIVASDNETVLPYFIDFFDKDIKQGSFLVSVPFINTGAQQAYWLYYGKSSATSLSTNNFLNPLKQVSSTPIQVSRSGTTFNSDWEYKMDFTVSNVATDPDNVVNRSVNVQIPSTWTSFWNNVRSDGGDIRFYDEAVVSGDPVALAYDIDYFDYAKKTASIDVNIQSQNTAPITTWPRVISLYYGNSLILTSSADINNAYDLYMYSGLDETKFTAGGAATADKSPVLNQGYVTLNNNSSAWDSYLKWNGSAFARTAGRTFQAKVYSSYSSTMMIGWKDNETGVSYSNLVHGFYFNNGSMYIYEDGSNVFSCGTYVRDSWYDIRIELKTMGALYYYKKSEDSDWILLYESFYSTETNLRPHIVHNSANYVTSTTDWKIFLNMTYDVTVGLGDIVKGEVNIFSLNEYYQDNPVIQPLAGVFYANNLASITEVSTIPAGSGLKHQISPDAWNWYWYNATAISKVVGTDSKDYKCILSHTASDSTKPVTGALYEQYWQDNATAGTGSVWANGVVYNSIPVGWNLVTAGYAQANTGVEINANLSSFQTLFPTGSLNFRTYLHSDDGTYTPELDNLAVALNASETFYTDKSGASAINALNADIADDQWVQYKAILYSDGRNTPSVSGVTLTYTDAWLNITSPNGGESWLEGTTHNITWTSQGIDGSASNVKLEYAPDNEATWKTIISSTANSGTYAWTLPNDAGLLTKVKVTSINYPNVIDKSNASFRLMGAEITSPNGGNIWELGKQHSITWNSGGTLGSGTLKFEYSLDNGSTWVSPEIASGQTDDGDLTWNITTNLAHASDNVKVRMTDAANTQVDDSSNAVFALVPPPAITFTYPLGSEQLKVGSQCNIIWTTNSQQFGTQFDLYYSKDGFVSSEIFIATVASGAPASPLNPNTDLSCSYAWTVPDDLSDNVTIRVREVSVPAGRDTISKVLKVSSVFKIVDPKLTVLTPNGGELWVKDEVNNITWNSEGTIHSGNLVLQYSKDGGSNWVNITGFDGVNDGLFAWTVPAEGISNLCKVRIKDSVRPTVMDDSDNTFKIIPSATIEVRSPNGGEIWTIGDTYTIQWAVAGQIGSHDVLIEYSKDNFVSDIHVIKPSTPNDGTESWAGLPDDPSADVKIRISSIQNPAISDVSDATFTICTSGITVISPNGGELWEVRNATDPTQTIHNIKWVSGSAVPDGTTDIVLKMSTNSGSSYDTTIATGRAKTGLYPWAVPNNVGNQIRVKAYSFGSPARTDESNADFSIVPVPAMTITSPLASGLSVWKIGASYDITWTKVGNLSSTVDLYYSTNGSTPNTLIVSGLSNSGTYRWRVPDVGLTNIAKVRVIESDVPVRDSTSKVQNTSMVFTTVDPVLTITSPNGAASISDAEAWVQGEHNYITWIPDGSVSNEFLIEYSRDSGANPTRYTIYDGIVPGTGLTPGSSYARAITIDNAASSSSLTNYQVRITLDTSALIPAKMRSDGNDIMFADEKGVCSYWIEPNTINTTQTKIWIKVPQIPALSTKKIYMYYGNPLAAVNQNFDTTFVKDVMGADIAGYWHFDEKQDSIAYDASGSGRNLGIVGATWYTSDGGRWGTQQNVKFSTGSCLVFDGASYAEYTGNIINDPDKLSVEAWIYSTDVASEESIVAKTGTSSSYALKIAAGGVPQFVVYDSTNTPHTASGNQALSAGVAYHLVGTYDGAIDDQVRLYIDGVLQTSTATSTGLNIVDQPVRIGNTFKGRIDEVSIHNRTLSLAEITAHFERRQYASLAPSVPTVQIEEPINKYSWTIPLAPVDISQYVKVYITDRNTVTGGNAIADASDNYFSIISYPRVTIRQPNGGEVLTTADSYNIVWRYDGNIGKDTDFVTLDYSINGGTSWVTPPINDYVLNKNGSFTWLSIPDAPSSNVKIRIKHNADPLVVDVSDAPFKIQGKFVLPSAAHLPQFTQVQGGSTEWIYWDTVGTINKVKLQYSKDGFVSDIHTIVDNLANSGSYLWTIPRDSFAAVKLRVVNYADAVVYDDSAEFIIKGLTLASPNGAESWAIATSHNITWNAVSLQGTNVKLEYSVNNGSTWDQIVASTPNVGSYSWTIPNNGVSDGQALVRVSDVSDSGVWDVSDSNFTITAGSLTGVEIQPVSNIARSTTNYNIDFTVQSPIPANGDVEIVFDADYNISGAAVSSPSDASIVSKINNCLVVNLATAVDEGTQSVYLYRQLVTLSSATTVADYQAEVDLTSANFTYAHAKADGGDIRFYSTAMNPLNYWIETWSSGGNSKIWVKIPNIGTTSFYIYYGKADALTASSIDLTMDPGLRFNYYDGTACADPSLGNGIDTDINHEWGTGVVAINGVGTDTSTLSIRWKGWVKNKGSGAHIFYTTRDDGIRLYLNGSSVIDNQWKAASSATENSYTLSSFSSVIPIQLDYYKGTGSATAKLGWAPADGTGKVYPIPQDYLYSCKSAAVTPTATLAVEDNVPAGKAVSLVITGIKNPAAKTVDAFFIETQDALDRAMDRGVIGGLTIIPGSITPAVTPGILEVSTLTSYAFAFTPAHTVEAGGKVVIGFDADYDLSAVGSSNITGNTGATLSVNNNTKTITVNLGSAITSTTTLTISNIKNPAYVQTTQAFQVATKTANLNVIDQGEVAGVVTIPGALVNLSAVASSLEVSATTDYTFSFTTDHALPTGYQVSIQLDADYDLSAVSPSNVGGNSGSTVSVNGNILTVTLGSSIPATTAGSLIINNIKNPAYVQTVDNFVIIGKDPNGEVIDQATIAGVITVAGNFNATLSISDVSSDKTGAALVQYTFNFTPKHDVAAGGTVRIDFDTDYNTSSASIIFPASDYTINTKGSNYVILNLTNPLVAGVAEAVRLGNITNPAYVQSVTFDISTYSASGKVDSGSSSSFNILPSVLLNCLITPSSYVATDINNHQIAFTGVTALAAGDLVTITFDSGYDLTNAVFSSGNSGAALSLQAGNKMVITLGTAISALTPSTFVVSGVKNPGAKQTAYYIITTLKATGEIRDQNSQIAKNTIVPGLLTNLAASSSITEVSERVESTPYLQFNFTLAHILPVGGYVVITFDDDYEFQVDTFCVTNDYNLSKATGSRAIILQRTTSPVSAGSTSIQLANIKNPKYVQTTGNFLIETKLADQTIIDTGSANGIGITAGSLTSTSLTAGLATVSAFTNYTVGFTTKHAIEAGGKVGITFDSDYEFRLSGRYACVTSMVDSSLTIMDITDPANPALKSEIADGAGGLSKLAGAESAYVLNNYIYAVSFIDSSLTIIDISNPLTPVLKSEITDEVGGFTKLGGASSVYVLGNYAYVTAATDNALTIIDISNPLTPVLKSEIV
ncbi:MAG: DUF2341 domain-containing protein, partial [Candidatus Omnitrophota bacterium]